MALWGRRQLPARSPADLHADLQRQEADLAAVYHLGETLSRAGIPEGSRLIGQTLAGSHLRETYGVNVLAIEHDDRILRAPSPGQVLRAEDVLILNGELQAPELLGDLDPLPPASGASATSNRARWCWSRRSLAALGPDRPHPRRDPLPRPLRHGGDRIWRAGRSLRTNLTDLPLELGDGLLLQGDRSRLPVLRAEPDLIVLDRGLDEPPPSRRRGRLALVVMLATFVIAATNRFGVGEVMLGGALLMILIGTISMDDAYQAIEWRSVFLVAGMLPLGTAMTKTGAADLITQGLLTVLGSAGPMALLAGLVASPFCSPRR